MKMAKDFKQITYNAIKNKQDKQDEQLPEYYTKNIIPLIEKSCNNGSYYVNIQKVDIYAHNVNENKLADYLKNLGFSINTNLGSYWRISWE